MTLMGEFLQKAEKNKGGWARRSKNKKSCTAREEAQVTGATPTEKTTAHEEALFNADEPPTYAEAGIGKKEAADAQAFAKADRHAAPAVR